MNLKELVKKQKILKIKINKTQQKIKTLKRKQLIELQNQKKIERKIRARILLRLGLIVEITNLNEYSINTILGHLFNFDKLSIIEIEELKKAGKILVDELDKFDEEQVNILTTTEKKARNHILIGYGALFEIAKLTEKELILLIGYCLNLYNKDDYYINDCEIKGKLYFLKNKRVKK